MRLRNLVILDISLLTHRKDRLHLGMSIRVQGRYLYFIGACSRLDGWWRVFILLGDFGVTGELLVFFIVIVVLFGCLFSFEGVFGALTQILEFYWSLNGCWVSRWMRNYEYLFRALSKLVNLIFQCHFLYWVFNIFNSNHSFIRQMEKDVLCLYCFLSTLLIPENQINPFVQIIRYIIGF